MSVIRCTFVAALWTLATGDGCGNDWNSAVVRLYTELFECGYLTDHRPVTNHETAVHVQIGLALRYYTFDNLEETLTVHSTVSMKWRDEFLQWEPSDFENIKVFSVAATSIWTPSVELFNAVGESEGDDWGWCNVTYKGQVSCTPDLEHTALCASDLRAWPYDTLTCRLYFGTWISTGEQVNFTLSDTAPPISFDECKDGPGWSLLDAQSTWLPNVMANNSFPVLKYELKFRREAAAEACGASGVGAAVALLPLAAVLGGGARLPLALFGVAAHMVALSELSWSVPRHGARSPRLLLACRTSLLVASAGVLAALLLAWLRARPVSAPPPPRVIATIVRIASTTPVNHFVFADLDSERQTLAQDERDPESSSTQWLDFANLLDALLCIIALIIYAVLVFT